MGLHLRTRHIGIAMLVAAMPLWWPQVAIAKQIEAVELNKSEQGDEVVIRTDVPVSYQVFDLAAPPRLVLNFPGTGVAAKVEPLRSSAIGVQSVFPVVAADGARLEIGLDQALPYSISEQGNRLVVRFTPPAAEAAQAAAQAAELHDLTVRDRGPVTEVVLRGKHMDASHNAFLTNDGRTMILDFWGASSKLPKEHYPVSTQRVRDVTVGQAEGRVRLVVGLLAAAEVKHQIEAKPEELVVRFGKVTPKRRVAVVQVQDVSFQPDDRVAHLKVRMDSDKPVVNLHEKDGNVIIDVEKATLAAGQERSLDVRDFPGPVKQVDAYKLDGKVRIVARTREKVNISSLQQGNVLTVTLEPEELAIARAGAKAGKRFAYTGQKVTFDFKDIDIRNALKLISELSGLNIIMSDDVTGKLTMRLVDVPWDQALDLILRSRGLGKEQVGNVMRIAPVDVLKTEYSSKLEARQSSEQLEPLVTEFITLSFTRVEDVKKMLEGASANATKGGAATTTTTTTTTTTGGTGAETTIGILSPRGSFLVDERTNTLILKDTEESINNIKRLIATIDKPVQQVLIEARIVEATDNFTRDLGVRWGGRATSTSPGLTVGGVQNAINPTDATKLTATAEQGFLVDLPAATGSGGALGLTFGFLQGAVNLDLELSAAEADDKIKIVSNPRLVTTNLKTAVIDQGTDIPFTSVSQNGTQVQFKKATLGLEVTPQITADNRVIMHVLVTKDSPTSTAVGTENNVLINTKKIDTEIFMDNGETIVIGGIYTRDKTKNVAGVPGLMKIPVLGWLFKKKKVIDNKSELLIFITPNILETTPGQGARLASSGM